MRFKNRTGETVSQAEAATREYPLSGRPDMYYMMPGDGIISPGGFIEVKTGQGKHRQRFDYAQWRDDQRSWYQNYAKPMRISLWIFLVLGGRIGGLHYPRMACLFPAQMLEQLEATDSRKSLSYNHALECLTRFRLEWAGNKTWDIPLTHPFRTQEERRDHANPTSHTSVL
jgi:hypothetical protein